MPLTAGIYARISSDRAGEGLGVERQRNDCLALAKAKGWDVVHVFDKDNDVSAYSGKPRKDYERLIEAVKAGQVDVIVAWHPDRLHRSPRELEDFISLVEARGVRVETVQAGQWDLSTPSGRMVARQLGSVARYESEHKAKRVQAALKQNAERGRPHGRRAYGWTRSSKGNDVINPGEADVVRTIADRIIAGESLRTITADLNTRHVPSPTGKPWHKSMFRHVVLRERNAGIRIHHGAEVADGAWQPILDRGVYEQLRAILNDPVRRTSTSSAAAYLLSGIGTCGVCGKPLRANMNRTVPSYRCVDGCVSRNRRDVDKLVTGVVLARLARPDAADVLVPDRSGERRQAVQEANHLRARLDRAADDYADGKIDLRQLERISARLRPQLEAAEARARIVDDSPLLDGLVGSDRAAEVWAGLSLTRRRAVVDLLLSVRILRGRPGARAFDPDTVAIEWRQP
jgi:site-specific DNA recombinase